MCRKVFIQRIEDYFAENDIKSGATSVEMPTAKHKTEIASIDDQTELDQKTVLNVR